MGLIMDMGSFYKNLGFLFSKEVDYLPPPQKIDKLFHHTIDNSDSSGTEMNTTKITIPPRMLKKVFDKVYEGDLLQKFIDNINSCYPKWATPTNISKIYGSKIIFQSH
jgi:hypothetical protein